MEQWLPWLILKHVPGVGNLLFKRLIDRFKTPENVLNASFHDLIQVQGIRSKTAQAIRSFNRKNDWFRRELDQVSQKGYRIVTLQDSEYPPLLREIYDPPPYLYVYGRLDASTKNIAIVGSRDATRYGLSVCRKLSRDLVEKGLTVVSGMARGIDTAAHLGALDGNGQTVAVLGSGLNRVYPPENKELFHAIASHGAVISEFTMWARPESHHFPTRNRIISGMSLGTVVVEASQRSGSLITARLAMEQNREVFAVPGDIQSRKSSGTHNLIKQGAKLVGHAEDVIEELAALLGGMETCAADDPMPKASFREIPDLTPEENQVVQELGTYSVHIDDLVRKLGMDPGTLSSILLQLELKGVVEQAPGKLFSLSR